MPATSHRSTPTPTRRRARAGPITRPRTYEQPALTDLPLNPRRSTYVLNLILQQHNWRHSSKHKGVSHKTIAERARFCHWLFSFCVFQANVACHFRRT
jgi:hypothetical protein